MRPLLLGEAPSRSGDRYHRFPLSGAVGQRLCEWAGIEPEPDGSRYGRYYWALREHFDCANVFERYAEATPWSASLARENWAAILGEDYPDQEMMVVVALGRRVGAAIGMGGVEDAPWGAWAGKGFGDGRALWRVVIPHPSGLNRLYNAVEMHALASRVLCEAMEIAKRQPGNEQWCIVCDPDNCCGCGPLRLAQMA